MNFMRFILFAKYARFGNHSYTYTQTRTRTRTHSYDKINALIWPLAEVSGNKMLDNKIHRLERKRTQKRETQIDLLVPQQQQS